MEENMKESGKTTKWKAMVSSAGLIIEFIKDSILMIKNTDKALLNGQMGEAM